MIRTFTAALLLAAVLTSPATAQTGTAQIGAALHLDAARIRHLAGLQQLAGRALDERLLHGRAVMVTFFASWCPPCTTEFEHMKLLNLDHAGEGLTIVAVNLFEDFDGQSDDGTRLKRFLERHHPVFSVVKGTADTAKLFGGVTRIPTVFVFDRRGRPTLRFVHAPGSAETNPGMDRLRDAVRNALGFGAAHRRPALPVRQDSVTNSSHINRLAVYQRVWQHSSINRLRRKTAGRVNPPGSVRFSMGPTSAS